MVGAGPLYLATVAYSPMRGVGNTKLNGVSSSAGRTRSKRVHLKSTDTKDRVGKLLGGGAKARASETTCRPRLELKYIRVLRAEPRWGIRQRAEATTRHGPGPAIPGRTFP